MFGGDSVMGSPIDVGGQYPFITFFTPPSISGKFLLCLVDGTTYFWCSKCNCWMTMHATNQHVGQCSSENPPNTANLGFADPSSWVAHLNVSNFCHVTSIPAIMLSPNQDLVSHIPDNFWDSFSSSIPDDDDNMLSDLAAEGDTTRPSDSPFLSVDPDEDAPLPEWAARTKVANAMDICLTPQSLPLLKRMRLCTMIAKKVLKETHA